MPAMLSQLFARINSRINNFLFGTIEEQIERMDRDLSDQSRPGSVHSVASQKPKSAHLPRGLDMCLSARTAFAFAR